MVTSLVRSMSQRAPAGRNDLLRNLFCTERGKYFTELGIATMRLTPAGPMSVGAYSNFAKGPKRR